VLKHSSLTKQYNANVLLKSSLIRTVQRKIQINNQIGSQKLKNYKRVKQVQDVWGTNRANTIQKPIALSFSIPNTDTIFLKIINVTIEWTNQEDEDQNKFLLFKFKSTKLNPIKMIAFIIICLIIQILHKM